MTDALETQVGGSHYKNMAYQPAEFIHDLKLRFNPGAIIKYIGRYKTDRIEDLRKASHFCEICKSLDEVTLRMQLNRIFPSRAKHLSWHFVEVNKLIMPGITEAAIEAVALGQWDKAKFNIEILIEYEHLKAKESER